jgi:Uncharacterized proteins, homologs of lactam utilization protein B
MAQSQMVTATTGDSIQIKADTICIHGDGPNALEFAHAIRTGLLDKGINIKAMLPAVNYQL